MQLANIGRNEPCLCGSGRKYKKCCLSTEDAAFAVGPSIVAAVDRAFEDNDWEPLHGLIDAGMTLFEPGGPLEYVRFAEHQMSSRIPDTAQVAQLCSGGWLRRCEREIAYVLDRYQLADDESIGLRLPICCGGLARSRRRSMRSWRYRWANASSGSVASRPRSRRGGSRSKR